MKQTDKVPPAPIEAIKPLLDVCCPEGTVLGSVYGKVSRVLTNYAEGLDTTFGRLRIMDVFDQRGCLQPKLEQHINSILRLSKQTQARHKDHLSEIRSNTRRLFRALYPSTPKPRKDLTYDVQLEQIPDVLKPILPHLPKVRLKHGTENQSPKLKESGAVALAALLKVWRTHDLKTLEELLVTHSADVSRELKKISPVKLCPTASHAVYVLRQRLELKLLPRAVPSPPSHEHWPAKLREEWDTFVRLATHGIGDNVELEISAKRLQFSVKKLAAKTIARYERGIGAALVVVPRGNELSIVDLIKITEPTEHPAPASQVNGYNELVDLFREVERSKEGFVNGVGYDSSEFFHFTNAVKAIAARNGYGAYIKKFNIAYKICFNRDAARERKEAKKAGISMEWVDDQIGRLNKDFNRIVRKSSYKRKPGRLRQADRDAALVCFYVILVTLRYMGYRQQSIVDCKLGTNIIFRPDGSIVLHFEKTKNGKRIHMELNESRRESHGLLLDVLNLYYRRVYPYLLRQSNNSFGGQFFVTGARRGAFRPFKDHKDLNTSFFAYREKFLDLDSLAQNMRRQLHPHFLRGMCTDWMLTVLHMTEDEVAEVLGDDPRMLKTYADQNRVRDAGAAFDAANARNRLVRESATLSSQFAQAIEKIGQSFTEQLKQKDQELEALRRELKVQRAQQAVITA